MGSVHSTWSTRSGVRNLRVHMQGSRPTCLIGSRSPMQCRLGTPILRAARPSGRWMRGMAPLKIRTKRPKPSSLPAYTGPVQVSEAAASEGLLPCGFTDEWGTGWSAACGAWWVGVACEAARAGV